MAEISQMIDPANQISCIKAVTRSYDVVTALGQRLMMVGKAGRMKSLK